MRTCINKLKESKEWSEISVSSVDWDEISDNDYKFLESVIDLDEDKDDNDNET